MLPVKKIKMFFFSVIKKEENLDSFSILKESHRIAEDYLFLKHSCIQVKNKIQSI